MALVATPLNGFEVTASVQTAAAAPGIGYETKIRVGTAVPTD